MPQEANDLVSNVEHGAEMIILWYIYCILRNSYASYGIAITDDRNDKTTLSEV